MRLTIVGPAYPLRGGIAHHVHAVHRDLVARGHELQVVSFKKLYPRLLFPGTTELDFSRLTLDVGAVPILTPMNPLSWIRASKAIREFAPDAVVIEWWNASFGPGLGWIARRLRATGIRSIADCHNIISHEPTPFDRALIAYAFKPMHSFITHSENDRSRLLSVVPDVTARVARLGEISEFYADSGAPRTGRTILFFGLVREYKGLDVLIKALAKVLERVDCHLLIAGEFYEPVEKYRRLINELGIENAVTIDNRYVPNEEVHELFAKGDVLVMPYLRATQSGIAQIALKNGIPIIASRSGGLAEVVQDNVNGLLFPTGDVDALSNRLLEYFEGGLGPILAGKIRSGSDSAQRSPIMAEVIEELAALR
ncbi:MAG TPA: glycosyltransferase [Blastocatellia bacterium]|nr:glycosyltransferase [Blastocatellia bacterium]